MCFEIFFYRAYFINCSLSEYVTVHGKQTCILTCRTPETVLLICWDSWMKSKWSFFKYLNWKRRRMHYRRAAPAVCMQRKRGRERKGNLYNMKQHLFSNRCSLFYRFRFFLLCRVCFFVMKKICSLVMVIIQIAEPIWKKLCSHQLPIFGFVFSLCCFIGRGSA